MCSKYTDMNSNKILIIDLETTGLSSFHDKILEIGIVELDLETGHRRIIFDQMFNPMEKFNKLKSCWVITNKFIDLRDVVVSDQLEKYRYEIQDIISSYDNGITAYNNVFDFGFLKSNGFDLEHKLDCPMKLATDVCKIKGKRSDTYKWPSVQECYDHLFPNNEYVEKHRGADDALHEAKIVYELYLRGIFKIK